MHGQQRGNLFLRSIACSLFLVHGIAGWHRAGTVLFMIHLSDPYGAATLHPDLDTRVRPSGGVSVSTGNTCPHSSMMQPGAVAYSTGMEAHPGLALQDAVRSLARRLGARLGAERRGRPGLIQRLVCLRAGLLAALLLPEVLSQHRSSQLDMQHPLLVLHTQEAMLASQRL